MYKVILFRYNIHFFGQFVGVLKFFDILPNNFFFFYNAMIFTLTCMKQKLMTLPKKKFKKTKKLSQKIIIDIFSKKFVFLVFEIFTLHKTWVETTLIKSAPFSMALSVFLKWNTPNSFSCRNRSVWSSRKILEFLSVFTWFNTVIS